VKKYPSWLGAISMGVAFIFLAWLSWHKWPDVLVDFGQQLYVPWQLSQGSVLYRDVACTFGCLSGCCHALLFKVFGVSLNVLLASNFLLLTLLLTIVYRGFLACADRLTAAMAGMAVTVFAFGQFLDVGNYNYVCPYSHEVWHGLVLSLVMITCLSRWLEAGQRWPLAVAGFCLGLAFLTKPEIFVGVVAPAMMALVFHWRQRRALVCLKSFLVLTGCSLIPLAGFFVYFCSATDAAAAFRAILGAWWPLLNSNALGIPFYQTGMGLDAPWFNLGRMLVEFGALGTIMGVCAWRLTRPALTSLERMILFAAVGAVAINYDWSRSGHALPLLVVCAALLLWRQWRTTPAGQHGDLMFPALWLGFSLLLMAKMGLNTRITHYGVFLAMPAFLSAIYLLLYLLPRWLERRGLGAGSFRAAMVILLLTGLARLVIHSSLFYKDKDLAVGPPPDRIMTYNPAVAPTGAAMASAADWIETHTAPTNTLAVIPEGAMLNYLTRRRNPTPYTLFMFEVWVFGEQTMLAAYQRNPPDYIVLIHRDSSELGVPYFGLKKGYGFDMMQWINRNYEAVQLIGSEPLKTNAFGIKILRRSVHGA
jgi:hypothetical protein